MDRSAWLKEIRRHTEEIYTTDASIYDDNWGSIDPPHQDFLAKFLGLCPPGSTILDAACGTGKYWSLILDRGRKVHGTDQSQGMLRRAQEKFPAASTEKTGLQEIHYQEAFDGAICMDAMENVFPEDWLPVLKNIQRAIKPKGYFYFTVELASEKDTERAFEEATQMGFPVVDGEWTEKGEYHYYPKIEQVKEWLASAGFVVIEEMSVPFAEADGPSSDDEPGYIGEGYYHILAQKN
jgi:cyclopropane fatty-acyl-phospholipid synthase-like methyltransferase